MKNEESLVIPRWIFSELKLSGNTALIYAAIYNFADKDGFYSGSNQELMDICGCCESTVTNVISRLFEIGLIEWVSFDGRARVLRLINGD